MIYFSNKYQTLKFWWNFVLDLSRVQWKKLTGAWVERKSSLFYRLSLSVLSFSSWSEYVSTTIMNLFETVLGSFSCGYNCQLSTTCNKKSKCLFLIETSQCVHTIHITDSEKYWESDFSLKKPRFISVS